MLYKKQLTADSSVSMYVVAKYRQVATILHSLLRHFFLTF